MPMYRIHTGFARVFTHRCFYLFVSVLVLVLIAPLLQTTTASRVSFNIVHLLVLISAVAAVGKSKASFTIAIVLAAAVVVFQWWALATRDETKLALSWGLALVFYLFVLAYLMHYVFREDVMTADKFYGAAAEFLLLAVFWTYIYLLLQWFTPGSFAAGGTGRAVVPLGELLYFSVTVITSTGFGDITPAKPLARSLVMFEQITGALYLAVLIARLTGVYPPPKARVRQ